ncbi:MAG: RNA polymerase sigma factor SigZ [Sedimentibacter sp.]
MKDSEINTVWNKFKNELLNFIKAKVKDEYEAEDILQEVFIKIYRNIEQLDDETKIKSWMYKITNNTIIDYYRKRKDSALQIDNIESILENGEENTNMNDEMFTCLKLFLYELPDKYKEPIEMYEFKGMKHREISKKLNISLSGSKTRIQRAREKLREVLTQCCEIEGED